MVKIFAFRTEPWTTFAKDSDSIFNEDFVKNKVFTFKSTHKPLKGIVKFKQMIQLNKEELYKCQEQIKIWFPFKNQGSSLFTLIQNNLIKIRYDHGIRSYGNNLVNFYGGAESQRNFKNVILKIGANLLFVNSNFDSRIRVAFTDAGTNQVSLAHKFNWTQGKWSVDFCKVLNLGKISLFKNSLRVIYRLDDHNQLFVKAENNHQRHFSKVDLTKLDTYFNEFTLDYIYKFDKFTVAGLQASFSNKNRIVSSIVAQKHIQQWNSKVKAKISTNKSISLSYEKQINYARWVVGCEISDIGYKNKTKFGVLLDLNL